MALLIQDLKQLRGFVYKLLGAIASTSGLLDQILSEADGPGGLLPSISISGVLISLLGDSAQMFTIPKFWHTGICCRMDGGVDRSP